MIIRDAMVGDVKQILDLLKEADSVARYGHPYDEKDILALIESPHWLSVVDDGWGEILAVMICYDMTTWGYIDLLYVKEGHRRQRHGTELIEYAHIDGPARWTTVEICVGEDDLPTNAMVYKLGFKWKDPVSWAIKERTTQGNKP